MSCLDPPLTRRPTDNVSAYSVLEKGLADLMDLCDVVTDKFVIARDEFYANRQQQEETANANAEGEQAEQGDAMQE